MTTLHCTSLTRRLSRMSLILMLALWVNGCAVFSSISESLFMMSTQEEVELGQKFKKEIDAEVVYVQDPAIDQYVDQLGEKVVKYAPSEPPFPVRFHVIQNKEINAFAIPGGDIFVQTGLIDAAEDEAELASVLAHELGHVIHRHSARQLSVSTGADMVQQILIGDENGQAVEIASGFIKQLGLFKYSREDELEADSVAVSTLYRMRYDPGAMSTFFAKLIDAYGDQEPLTTFFATHPPTKDRIARVETMIDTLPAKQYQRPVTQLRTIQGRITSLGLDK